MEIPSLAAALAAGWTEIHYCPDLPWRTSSAYARNVM
jgi:hypothetical protein